MKMGPLAGYTIGVTADRRAEEQAQLLERRGARVLHGPTIRTLPLAETRLFVHSLTICRCGGFVITPSG